MVYEKFFYLKENPFNITPDPRFLYLSRKHQEALDLLFFGVSERKGFLMLSGEVGTGKTTICRTLLDKLNAKVKSAMILNPLLSDIELLMAINEDFGLKADSPSLKEQLDILNSFLLEKAKHAGNAVVIIDEAQNLSPKALEMIRLLSNLETEKMKLLQIVLVGQPELREKLKLPELRQLNQRIVVRYHLGSLNFEETKTYIFKRLTIAGGKGNIRFTSTALKSIYEASSGIPRLINIICDRSLTAAFVAGKRVIDEEVEQKAVYELDMDGTLKKDIEIPHKKSWGRSRRPGARYISYMTASAVIVAVMFAVWWNNRKPAMPPLAAAPRQYQSAAGAAVIKSVSEEPEISQPTPTQPLSESGVKNDKPPQISPAHKLETVSDKAMDMQPAKEDEAQSAEAAVVKETVMLRGVIILLNDVEHIVSNGEILEVLKGDKFKIIDAIVEGADSEDVSVNLLGFVPARPVNKGEDRGYVIDTADGFRVKYSLKKQGVQYPIVVKREDKKIGEVFIKIANSKQ